MALFSRRVRRLLTCAIVEIAAIIGFYVLAPRTPPDPLDLGAEGFAVLRHPDRVDAFVLERNNSFAATPHATGTVPLGNGYWSRGPAMRLTPALIEAAQQAVLDPSHYDRNPPPNLCAWDPSWALRFTRGQAVVDVLVDRGCTRADISGQGSRGAPIDGGGKLTAAGHDAFHAVLSALHLPGLEDPPPRPDLRRFAESPADTRR